MASVGAIATINSLAFKRLFQAMTDINSAYPDVEPVVLPSNRDPRYQEAARNDAMASWAERLAVAMGVSSVVQLVEVEDESENTQDGSEPESEQVFRRDELAFMTLKQLKGIAKGKGVELSPTVNNQDVVDAILAHDAPEPKTDKRPDAEEATEVTSFQDMTVQHLKDYAAKAGIDLGDATKKADIISALEAKG